MAKPLSVLFGRNVNQLGDVHIYGHFWHIEILYKNAFSSHIMPVNADFTTLWLTDKSVDGFFWMLKVIQSEVIRHCTVRDFNFHIASPMIRLKWHAETKIDVAHLNRELTQKEEMQKSPTGHNDAQQTAWIVLKTKERKTTTKLKQAASARPTITNS